MDDQRGDLAVGSGMVVALHYTLYDEAAQVLETSEKDPIQYLHGAENIVAGLEEGLAGHRAGERVTVRVTPQRGYGERREMGVRRLPRERFPADVALRPGMPLGAQGPDGQPLTLWVVEVGADSVTLDFNHPLAGKTITFEVAIESVRAATREELEAGRPLG